MRIVFAILTALGLTFGAFTLARGDDAAAKEPVDMQAFKALQDRVDALQAEVRYLRSREEALSGYVLKNEQRGKGLESVVAQARRAGFEAAKIPVDSRKILLAGLEAAARGIRQDLPRISSEQKRMLAAAKKARAAAGLND